MKNDIFSQHSLNFSDIVKHNKENVKKINSMMKSLNHDIDNLKFLPYVNKYYDQIKENRITYQNNLLNITGSKEYSTQMAFLNECQQWYAVYFLHYHFAKTLDQRMTMIEHLFYISEITIHATLKYFNFELNEPLEWDTDTFYGNEDICAPNIVNHVVESLDHLCNFICAVDKNDTTRVYESYTKICESRMQPNVSDPFPEFN